MSKTLFKRTFSLLAVCATLLQAWSLTSARAEDSDAVNFKARLQVPVQLAVPNPCTNEQVQLSGNIKGMLHVVRTPNGRLQVKGQANTQGIKGVGASGLKYVASGTAKLSGTSNSNEFLLTANFRLISQGSSDNLKGRATFRVVIDTQAKTATATLVSADLNCK